MAGLFFVWNSLHLRGKITIFLTVALVAAAVILISIPRAAMIKELTIEAGGPVPQGSEFMAKRGKTGWFLSGIPDDTSVPGVYDIDAIIGNKNYTSKLIIQDTIAPTAIPADVAVWAEATVQPADFVREVYDATEVSLSFENAPDTSITGARPVAVLLTDAGGNTTRVVAELRVYDTVDKLDVKPDTDKSGINVFDFVKKVHNKDKERFIIDTDLQTIDFNIPGRCEVVVLLDGKRRLSLLDIFDVTPPTATPVHVRRFISDTLDPWEFVDNIFDQTPVTVSFVSVPDNMLEGDQAVMLLLTDAYGNTAQIASSLTLVRDTEPPVIGGMLDKTVFPGDTIAYRLGITVTDNRDDEVELKIDSSKVDAKTEGAYPVVYSATDSSGNTTIVKGTITVLGIMREQVYEMADKVLADIISEDMSLYDQAYAIYLWVKRNIGYINSSVKDDPVLGAYRAFKNKSGDCFVFASVSELLLTRAGIDNILIHRISSARTRHYWSLVNVGEGWYHFDTTPHNIGGYAFMLTESEVQALAIKRGSSTYYAYDKSLYPEVVE
jgi:hypothetical protein